MYNYNVCDSCCRRSVHTNRERAKEKLITALDNHLNGADSVESQARRIKQALHQISKDTSHHKRQRGLLARLRAKEDHLLQKLDALKSLPGDQDGHYQTDQKIALISDELNEIRDKISKVRCIFRILRHFPLVAELFECFADPLFVLIDVDVHCGDALASASDTPAHNASQFVLWYRTGLL